MKKLRINDTLLFLFLIINTLVISYLSYAMDAQEIKIPAQHIAFLPNNRVAIASNESLIFYGLDDNKPIKTEKLPHSVDDIAINKTKSRLAVSCREYVKQCNTLTLKSCGDMSFKQGFFPITFNSQQNNQLVIHDSCPDFSHSRLWFLDGSGPIETCKCDTWTRITCHPHKAEIIYISRSERNQCFCSKSIATPNEKDVVISYNKQHYYASEYLYSPDARYILVNQNSLGLSLQRTEAQLNTDKVISCTRCLFNTHDTSMLQFPSAIFHPSSKFLVTLSHRYMLQYWDCETVEPYHSTTLCTKNITIYTEVPQRRLSFSPEGTHLAIALPDKCLILPVPRDIIISSFGPELQKIILLLLCTKYTLR